MKNFGMIRKMAFSVGLMSCAIAFTGCGAKEINLNDYLDVSYSGYDSAGVATSEFDIDKMIKDNSEAFGIKGDVTDSELLKIEADLDDVIDGSLDKTTDLSNGDSVSYKWNVSMTDPLKEKYKVEFVSEDKEFKVDSLDKVEEFDPFENLEVTFGGIAPNGSASLSGSIDDVPSLYFEADKTSGLKNGDVIKITLDCYGDDVKSYCLEYGKVPTELEKEVTVEGLSSYVSKIDEIPEDMQEKMKQQAIDSFNADSAGWAEGNSLENAEFLGYYFLTPKEGFYASSNNELYCVYKMTSNVTGLKRGGDGETQESGQETYYTYYHYSDIMLLEDGTCSVDLSNGYMTNNSIESDYGKNGFFGADFYRYKGYKDLDSMFNECVTKKISECNYESTVQ